MKTGLRKRWQGSDAIIVFQGSGMDASRCADEWQLFHMHMCSGFPTGRSEQMIVTS